MVYAAPKMGGWGNEESFSAYTVLYGSVQNCPAAKLQPHILNSLSPLIHISTENMKLWQLFTKLSTSQEDHVKSDLIAHL